MTESTFETVTYEKCGQIAHITLNRPDVINAFNVQMRDDLSEVLDAVRWDLDVAVVLIKGSGDRGFCAGADLSEFGSAPSQAAARNARWERDVFGVLRDLTVPTVAVLHGLCDIRIAADNAVFSMPETYHGLIAAAGGTQTLPRALKQGRALDMLLTGRRLNASDAGDAGLIQRVVKPDDLEMESERIASDLAEIDPALSGAIKTALATARDLPLAGGLAPIMLDRGVAGT